MTRDFQLMQRWFEIEFGLKVPKEEIDSLAKSIVNKYFKDYECSECLVLKEFMENLPYDVEGILIICRECPTCRISGSCDVGELAEFQKEGVQKLQARRKRSLGARMFDKYSD